MLEWSAGLISMTFYNFLFSCWIWTTWGTIGLLHLSLSSFPLFSYVISYTALWPQTALGYAWKWRKLEKIVMVSTVLLCTVDSFLHLFSPHPNEPLEIKKIKTTVSRRCLHKRKGIGPSITRAYVFSEFLFGLWQTSITPHAYANT